MGRIRWRWILAVAASAGIVTTLAGAHGGSPALIHACVNKVSKIVRIVPPGAKCKRSERALDWPSQTAVGPQGIQGPQGPPGERGEQGSPAASFMSVFLPGTPGGAGGFVPPTGTATYATFAESAHLSPNASIVARDLAAQGKATSFVCCEGGFAVFLVVDGVNTGWGCVATVPPGTSSPLETSCTSGTSSYEIPPASEIAFHVTENATSTMSDVRFGWRATTP